MFAKEDYKEIINPRDNYYPTWTSHKQNIIHFYTKLFVQNMIKKIQQIQINRNKLDNRFINLRFATQSEQNQNQDKRRRQKTAKDLPTNIKQSDLPKFVVYYSEKYGPNKEHSREWFNIEKHPNLIKKRWSTTKSNKITIINKLESVKSKIEELEELDKLDKL